ncbi:MAG: hemolysin III family protein [Lachnospira sp.]|jgi:hemolysin III|nr:hemolysin III family protein [Lachnospira sp.]
MKILKHFFTTIKIKDPGSAITHFIGMLMAIFAALPLIIKSLSAPDIIHVISLTIFIVSMILLYAASTTYHTFDISPKVNQILKKLDHCMISVMIAGSYTPVCLIVLHGATGYTLLALVWGIALLGIVFKLCWVSCPRWVSSALYIIMGWVCVLSFTQIINALPTAAFIWLLMGGVIYTIGGIIYALKLKVFNNRHKYFGSHEIFHLFVMAGSACHFIMMFNYVATLPIL